MRRYFFISCCTVSLSNALRQQHNQSNNNKHNNSTSKSSFDAKREREQREAAEALQRISGRVRSSKRKSRTKWTSDNATDEEAERVRKATAFTPNDSFVEVNKQPRFSLFSYFQKFNQVPINPLHNVDTLASQWTSTSKAEEGQHNPESRASLRLLQALQLSNRNKSKRSKQQDIQLSEEQKNQIILEYSKGKWWYPLYYPFRSWTDLRIKWSSRIALLAVVVCSFCLVLITVYMYGWETDQILQLSNEDQEDYLFLLNHVRYGDIYKLMEEVIKKQDPLGALPPPAIMHLTLEEARRLGWMTTDWELKNRTLHPQNALMEGDIYHLFYWGTLTLGSLFGGGGAMFSKGAADLALLRSTSKVEGDFVETVEGPKTRAESKRGFFS